MSNEELAVLYQAGDGAALAALWVQVEKLATVMVRRYIGLAHKNRAVDFDELLQAAFLAVERAASAFHEDRGSFASVMGFYVKSELAALLGLRGRVRREHYEAVSTSTPIGEDGTASIGDLIPDDSLPEMEDAMLREDIRREVHAALDRLTENEAAVMRGCCLEGRVYADMALQMGVSVSYTGQVKARAMRQMRRDWQGESAPPAP